MTINKKLIHFKNKQDFNNAVTANNILDTSIVFIKDGNSIYTHNTEYPFVNWCILSEDVADTHEYFLTSENFIFKDSNGNYLKVKKI